VSHAVDKWGSYKMLEVLRQEIDTYCKTKPGQRYTGVADFVQTAVREKLERIRKHA